MLCVALLVVAACTVSSTHERLGELFDTLRRTHGGPAYIPIRSLQDLQQHAEKRLREDDSEEAFLDVCSWAMRQLLDPLATHMRPSQAVAARERFHGRVSLGLKLEMRFARQPASGRLWHGWRRVSVVRSVEEGSAAEHAGLQAGDEVLEVCGLPLVGASREEALEIVDMGPEGEVVPITLRKRAAIRTVKLTRTIVPLSTVSCRPLSCGAMRCNIVTISSFGSTTAAELRAHLRKLRSTSKNEMLVFDLRGNEGGLLPEAISACRMLLPRGAHILSLCKAAPPRVVKSYHRRWFHRSELPGVNKRRDHPPYVVLVDRASASSAEVFAGALAQSGGALVVGQCTYGKGSSQAVVYQSDGHAVSFTAYTLAVGRRRGRQMLDLAMGVEPQVRWRWRTARSTLPVANAELERALVTACMTYTAA